MERPAGLSRGLGGARRSAALRGGGFSLRVQTEADLLAEADWALVTIPHLSFIRIGSSSSE